MEKKDIFRKVGMIMGELHEQYQYLSERPENLNDLELELFLANSNFLTDHIEILRKMNGSLNAPIPVQESHPAANPIPENKSDRDDSGAGGRMEEQPEEAEHSPAETAAPQVAEAAAEAEHAREEVMSEADDNKKDITEAEVDVDAEKAGKAADEQPVEKSAEAEEIVKEVVIPERIISVEARDEPGSIPTINDMISAQVNSSTVATQFTNKPVADLKAIISLNDKLLFTRELFNGYSLAYSEAIELLNRFDSFESADSFLKANYASKNNWKEKQPAADKLYEILNRRFAK